MTLSGYRTVRIPFPPPPFPGQLPFEFPPPSAAKACFLDGDGDETGREQKEDDGYDFLKDHTTSHAGCVTEPLQEEISQG